MPNIRSPSASTIDTGLLLTVGNVNVTSSTIPTNGLYLPAANTVGIATNGTLRVSVSTTAASIGLNTIVGSTSVTPDGTLHVHTATAGTVAAPSYAEDLVVEGAQAGISVLSADAAISYLNFASPTNNGGSYIEWGYSQNSAKWTTTRAGATIVFRPDNNVTNLTLSGASGSELATFAGDVTLSEGKLTVTDTANENAVSITSSAITVSAFVLTVNDLTSGSGMLIRSTSGSTTARPLLDLTNSSTAATGLVNIRMQQSSANAFIGFVGTAAANTTDPISTLTTSGATTHHIQIDINGTKAWIACSTNNPS